LTIKQNKGYIQRRKVHGLLIFFCIFLAFANTYQKKQECTLLRTISLHNHIRTAMFDGSLFISTPVIAMHSYTPSMSLKIPLKPMLLGSLHRELKGTKLVSFACKSHLLLYKYTRSQHTRMQLMHDTSEINS